MYNTIAGTNFTGGFGINYRYAKQFGLTTRRELEKLMGDNVQIINNYSRKSYMIFYILDDRFDSVILDFISRNKKLAFFYYPEINTLGSNIKSPAAINDYIGQCKTRAIRNTRAALDYIETRYKKPAKSIKKQKPKFDDFVMTILENLCIENLSGKQYVSPNGVTKIYEKCRVGQFKMSPPDENGYRFVYAIADDFNAPEYRCLVDGEGNIQRYFINDNEKIFFKKLFNNYVKKYNFQKVKN